MKHAILILCIVLIGLVIGEAKLGYNETYSIAYGAIIQLSVVIAITFLWLWKKRATPLALGMAFSWSGQALVLGWWLTIAALGHPLSMIDSPLLFFFIALQMVGAVLHFMVIERTLDLPKCSAFLLPVLFVLSSFGLALAL